MTKFDFSGRKILVTGGSRRIGLGIARGLIKSRADVTILASDSKTIEIASKLSDEYGCSVAGLVCDITDRDAVASTVGRLERIDVLINNAGLELITPIDTAGSEVEETFRRIIDINVMGTYYVTREALGRMHEGGRIILTSSMWGKSAVAEFSAYCTSKHANIGFMRSMAHELAPRGISVNAVCPGWVRTAASMRSLTAMAERENRNEDELLAEIVGAQALGGLMEPEDMAATYLFLASDAADNITGQAWTVDRGELMQ